MCGEEVVETLYANWVKYAPKILELGGENSAESHEIDEVANYKILHILDKKLRPSGPSSKSLAAFAIYEVN